MLAEPIRWSHASGNRVVPSPWQMTEYAAALPTDTYIYLGPFIPH